MANLTRPSINLMLCWFYRLRYDIFLEAYLSNLTFLEVWNLHITCLSHFLPIICWNSICFFAIQNLKKLSCLFQHSWFIIALSISIFFKWPHCLICYFKDHATEFWIWDFMIRYFENSFQGSKGVSQKFVSRSGNGWRIYQAW